MANTNVSMDSGYIPVQLLLRLLPEGEELKTRILQKIAIKATLSANLKDTGYKGERAPQELAGYKDFHDGGGLCSPGRWRKQVRETGTGYGES